ncbi:MAG: hypothetical protein WA941_21090 [Nitrososphaeraceae archaeon]
MGENWLDYIIEAGKRCLAKNGLLFIAETTKSRSGRLSRLRKIIKERGFEIYSGEERGDFTLLRRENFDSVLSPRFPVKLNEMITKLTSIEASSA